MSGGHAVMIRVSIDKNTRTVADQWAAGHSSRQAHSLEDAHLTLLFVGRNMTGDDGQKILDVVANLRSKIKIPEIRTTGRGAMFGVKRDHMVALVEKSDELMEARKLVQTTLFDAGVKPVDSDWGFNPHVTLGTGAGPAPQFEPMRLIPTILVAKIGDYRENFHLINVFPCGCSRLKVAHGRCDLFREDGNER